jgi:hypothetical protein
MSGGTFKVTLYKEKLNRNKKTILNVTENRTQKITNEIKYQ